MMKVAKLFNRYKKIIILSVALIFLVVLAAIMFSGKTNEITINSTVAERTETETRLMQILSEINGVGKAEVMINEDASGIKGVVIVCEGGNNLITRSDVINVVKVVLNIDKNNIAIYAMN